MVEEKLILQVLAVQKESEQGSGIDTSGIRHRKAEDI